jgi:hypothetical protein
VIISLSASFVSAQGGLSALADFIDDTVEGFTPLLEPALGVDTSVAGGGGTLFAKVLLVILVLLIIMAVLDQIDLFAGRKKTEFFIGLIVGILGVRFLPNNMVDAILFPSTAFVGALTIGIPFIIYGIVLSKLTNPMMRKVGWIIFGVLLFIMATYNDEAVYLYTVFIIVCAIAFWYDGTLHRWFRKSAMRLEVAKGTSAQARNIMEKIAEAEDDLGRAETGPERAAFMKKIKELNANLRALK